METTTVASDSESSAFAEFLGRKLFIRTLTYHLLGEVVAIVDHFFELKDASWVADSGRFMQAIKGGTLKEVEPVGSAWVNIEAITDMFPWNHELPNKQR